MLVIIFLRLYKSDRSLLRPFTMPYLQFCYGCIYGLKLSTCTLIDVVLVMQNVLNVEFQLLKIFSQLSHIGSSIGQ